MGDRDGDNPPVQTDEAVIGHLLAAYCHALDERRFDAMGELFTEDATLTTRFAGSVHLGPTAICEYLESRPESMRGLHLTVNPEIDIDGDTARVRSDFVVVAPRPSHSLVASWGWYNDVVTRDDGAWKFRERHIETQWRIADNTPLEKTSSEYERQSSPLDRSESTQARRAEQPERAIDGLSLGILQDQLEIRNLVARIAQLADMSETLDSYLECFSDDAVWEFGGNPHEGLSPVRVEGRDALKADRLARRERGVQGPGTPNRHIITTLAVHVNDDGTAGADSYFLLLTDTTSNPRIRNVGHYLDTFARTQEGWKLTSRTITTG